jgi:hypothetical protein
MAKQPQHDNQAPARAAKPDDIQIGETQFLRYQNGLIRGKCNSNECVVITWASGFTQSAKADTWNDREFLERPHAASLVGMDQFPAAHAFFYRMGEQNKATARKRPGMR